MKRSILYAIIGVLVLAVVVLAAWLGTVPDVLSRALRNLVNAD